MKGWEKEFQADRVFHYPHSFSTVLRTLARVINQERKIIKLQIVKEVKLSLFANYILHMDTKISTRTIQNTVNNFRKWQDKKINLHKINSLSLH